MSDITFTASSNEQMTPYLNAVAEIKKTTKSISGASSDTDPSDIITSLENAVNFLNDAVNNFASTTKLSTPNLSQIVDLLKKIQEFSTTNSTNKIELPNSATDTVNDLVTALTSLSIQLPIIPLMMLYYFFFYVLNMRIPPNMVTLNDLVQNTMSVDMIKNVKDVIGYLPQIYNLVAQLSVKTGIITSDKLKKLFAQELKLP